ncbi:hypothetical protein D3C77_528320 [compost metagenome]
MVIYCIFAFLYGLFLAYLAPNIVLSCNTYSVFEQLLKVFTYFMKTYCLERGNGIYEKKRAAVNCFFSAACLPVRLQLSYGVGSERAGSQDSIRRHYILHHHYGVYITRRLCTFCLHAY